MFGSYTALISAKHINTLIRLNNYMDVYLSILGEHILSLHDKISHLCSELGKPKIIDKEKKKATPTIQLPSEIKDFKLSKIDNIERFLQERFSG